MLPIQTRVLLHCCHFFCSIVAIFSAVLLPISLHLIYEHFCFGNYRLQAFATTVFHEAIHAHITTLAQNLPNVAKKTYPELFTWFSSLKGNQNDMQHALFAEKHIEDIAKSVEQLGKKLGYFYDYQFYKDLAWKGLTGTNAFLKKNPNQMDRDRIINTIKAEQYGITVYNGGHRAS